MRVTCELNTKKMVLVGPTIIRDDGSAYTYYAKTVEKTTSEHLSPVQRLETWADGRFVPEESRDAGVITSVSRRGSVIYVEVDVSDTVYATYTI